MSRSPQGTTGALTKRELSDRLALFARAIGAVSGLMLVAGLAMAVATEEGGTLLGFFTEPYRIVHVAATVSVLAVWRVCRRVDLPLAAVEGIDAALTLGLCSCWALLSLGADPREPMEITIALALAYTLIARSVAIPSSFQRTLWISLLSIVPTTIVFAHRRMSFIPEASASQARGFVIMATLWNVVAAVTAALNSRQLYGLRAQVREFGKLGQYTLESKLGEGGMGVVYRASHAMLRRPAAIKLLLPERSGEKDLVRFEREVQQTSRLAHPNTVSIFDYGRTAEGVFYYVMEYLDGLDLKRLVDHGGPLEASRAIHILVQASGALAEAHALGLIHRDIKPANIMLTERTDEPDVVKVVDFGLVRTMESEPQTPGLTGSNVVSGTPMYLAPEAITSPDAVDARADVYALGAVAYFLLTGEDVFSGKSVFEVCTKHLHEAPTTPSERLGKPVADDLESVVLACIAKRPEDRPASAALLRDALLACADAGRYDKVAARAWWVAYRANAHERDPDASTGRAATMTIDLRHRDATSHAAE